MSDLVEKPEGDDPSEPEVDGLAGVPAPLAEAMRKRSFVALTSVQRAMIELRAKEATK